MRIQAIAVVRSTRVGREQRDDSATRTARSSRVDDNPIPGGVSVKVGIGGGLKGRPLRGLVGVNRTETPVAYDVFHEPVAVLEERQVINRRQSEAVRPRQGRDGALCVPMQKVFRTARSEAGGKELCSAVVDGAAVSV